MSDLREKLILLVTRAFGASELSGGANMGSWSFEWAGAAYVLRRAPSADYMAGRLSIAQSFVHQNRMRQAASSFGPARFLH